MWRDHEEEWQDQSRGSEMEMQGMRGIDNPSNRQHGQMAQDVSEMAFGKAFDPGVRQLLSRHVQEEDRALLEDVAASYIYRRSL